jgi:hypothetical protein
VQQGHGFGKSGGFSAKFNNCSSVQLLCKVEVLCFDFRHFAKLKTVMGKLKKHIGQMRADHPKSQKQKVETSDHSKKRGDTEKPDE